jgi:hypothetical protein
MLNELITELGKKMVGLDTLMRTLNPTHTPLLQNNERASEASGKNLSDDTRTDMMV